MVTIKELAKECGVSTATVSNVINGKGRVGAETINKVLQTAEELSYVPNALAKSLKENNLDKGKLGTLLEVMPMSWYMRLRKELPELEIVDVSKELFEIRTHKSLEEADVHRQCAKIALEGYKAFVKAAVPGAYEHEVVAEAIGAMQKYGCDDFFMLIASGKFSAKENHMTTLHNAGGLDRKLEEGDSVSMEITPYFNGCWTQLVRTLSVGKPNADVDEFAGVTARAIAAAVKIIKPGVPIASLVTEMRKVIEGEGYKLAMPCGHICGADLNEERLSEDNMRELLPGMCVIIHPTVLNDNLKSSIYWGETYLVTETGVEPLM